MGKPRYDPDKNESRHAAAEKSDCDEMADKYDWKLKRVEESGDPILEVDCVFEGDTNFPKSYYEKDDD